MFSLGFIFNSCLTGVGLAMDAFSVSLANGLKNPRMRWYQLLKIAGTFAWFQFMMPMIGWFCVHTLVRYFKVFEKFIPYIALILLLYIGINMLKEGMSGEMSEEEAEIDHSTLLIQGIATSIDALSVGFTIASYNVLMAFVACVLIAIVTLVICLVGLRIGIKFGEKLAEKATILGGCILIFIGLEIFVTGVFM
ncbi:manganese efflux pump [Sharpea azabuensis]|uniref:Putative manganese efflux pump MntP n=1 Tax=Sharpea porci TaxID=2652286 RepID=A0A844FV25_9FIRM|nr:manganese efflux pump MntP family protein [Sharpea porci]MST89475.1 manganese efflux pump [Sharpea porci]